MIHIRMKINQVWRGIGLLLCAGLLLTQAGSASAMPTPYPKPGDIYVWDATSYACNYTGPVWCVKNTLVNNARHFYLTKENFTPSQAKIACASDYHMASLWELLNVSKLVYDYDHVSAYTRADGGWGPPSGWNGWVRTGWSNSGEKTTGTGNCKNWSSASSIDYGVSVRLSHTWEMAVRAVLPIVVK